MKDKKFKRNVLASLLLVMLLFLCNNVYATEYGEGDYCLNLNIGYENDFSAENVQSVTVNNYNWANGDDIFNANVVDGKLWTIVIVATKRGDDFPFVSTPGGLVVDDPNSFEYPGYGSFSAIPNPENENEYIFTITLKDTWGNKGSTNPKTCGGYGVTITSGPPIEKPSVEVTSAVTITIKGEELEYHYVEDKPDEADVTYFKFDINGGTEEYRLVPFTFGNANYTHNDKEPPKNVTQVTTKEAIQYKYNYNESGTVTFCVNGGGTDEYTSIKINDEEYANFAPHTKEKYWEAMSGWAQMFCIPNVPYRDSYDVVVEGRQTADENKIPGFGWSYLAKNRSEDIEEEGNFAHGRLEFVSASLVIDGEEEIFGSVNSFNNYLYNNKGQIFQWNDGNKEYQEEDRRMAWGSAQMPYGTKLRVRIVPDKGYQLTGLTVSENGFKPTETPGEYELELTRTNLSYNDDNNQFNLDPRFEKVDATAISDSRNVSNVEITIKGNTHDFDTGTPKLEVTDVASMSPEREQEFVKATEKDGYTINNYLEISLYNAIFQGGKKDGDKLLSWDTEIHELEDKATISLELQDALAGNEVAVVHEVRDADNKVVGYDVLDAQYDYNKRIVTFETDGFSTYAIAVKEIADEDSVTIEFNTLGGTQMQSVRLHKGDKLEKPQDPENGKRKFEGWFIDEALHDEYDFNEPINNNITLFAKWSDDEASEGNEENEGKDESYIITDADGNTISFNEFPDRKFTLTTIDYLKLTKEELFELTEGQVTKEQYDEVVKLIQNEVKDKGTLLAFYEIVVSAKNEENEDYNVEKGPLTIKIKITDQFKNYKDLYLTFIDMDENNNIKKGEVVKLSISDDGKYLVGTLPHLSKWALTGTYDDSPANPQTGDNIMNYVLMLGISISGFLGIVIYVKRKRFN